MSEEKSFEQMIDESIKTIHTGEIVDGTVISVKPDEIVLNIGYKSDGIITKSEYSNNPDLDLTSVVSVGDPLQVKILKVNDGDGQVALSYKRISEEKANKAVEEAFNNKEVITVKVEKITTGGLITSYESAKVFVPASLVSDVFEKDLSKYLGQEIEVLITEFNPRKRRVIGNRRKLVLSSKNERAKELLETLRPNDIVEGEVKSVTAFGAFIDLGGVDGLLHVSEMSWGRINTPKDAFHNGDKVRVFIKTIEDGKIALSCKFPDENPWVIAKEKYTPGTIIKGKIARLADFGAFVELEPGIDALLHVSQISKKHVKKPSDVLKVGQEIEAKIDEFKEEEKKISLTRRDFEDDLVPDDYNANEVKEAVKEKATEVKEAAEAKVEEVKEAASEKLEEVKEAASEKLEEVKEAASEKLEEVKEAASEKLEEVKEAASEKLEEVKEAALDKALEKVEEIKEAIEEAKEN